MISKKINSLFSDCEKWDFQIKSLEGGNIKYLLKLPLYVQQQMV